MSCASCSSASVQFLANDMTARINFTVVYEGELIDPISVGVDVQDPNGQTVSLSTPEGDPVRVSEGVYYGEIILETPGQYWYHVYTVVPQGSYEASFDVGPSRFS